MAKIYQGWRLMMSSKLVPELRFKEFSGEWEEKKLGEICNFQQGIQVNLELQLKEEQKNYIKFLRIENYTQNSSDFRYIPNKNISDKQIINKDDIVIVRYGATAGYIGRDFEGVLANNLFKVIPTINLNNEYLYYFLNLIKTFNFFQEAMSGGAMPALSFGIVGSLKFQFPPTLAEQQKIANTFSSLDNLIEAQTKKVELLKSHKKGLMQKLFPRDGAKVPEIRFKEFSGEWEEKPISDLADRYDNLRIPISATDRTEGTTPYYGANGIQSYISGYTHDGEFILIAEDGANDLKNYPVQYVNGKIWVNNHAHVLQGKRKITNNIFLMYAIKNLNMEPYLVGGGRAKLNANIMMKILILIPPTPQEQQKIADTLSSLDNLIEAQNKKIELLKEHKKGLMQKMFVGDK